jgi:uncharacterized protein (TIGR02271 family)
VERTVFGLFDDVLAAQRVAVALERDGFDRSGMSLLAPDPRGRYVRPGPEGGRAFTPVSVPGIGTAAVAGPMTEALAEGAGLIETLTAAGFAEPDARHYFESLRRGQALFAVESPDERVNQVVEMMRRLGARAVDEIGDDAAPAAPAPTASTVPAPIAPAVPAPTAPMVPAPTAPMLAPETLEFPRPAAVNQVTVPVVEEELEVGKRQVNRGGVRIHSHIVEEPVEERVSLREERVTVERRPVYRDATEADLADFKEGTIEIHETIEEPVISKRRRVVEEIVIGREARERTTTISETIRRTQVDVEPLTNGHDAG